MVAAWRFVCPPGALAAGRIDIESRLFLRVAPSHLHFIAVRDTSGRNAEAVLTSSRPRASLSLAQAPAAASFWQVVARFLPIGAQHVWSGLDHIAFMLALVLLVGGQLRAALFAATGFTLGHTATLGLAATGILHPDTRAIEALIGFTIAFVALDVGADGDARMRPWSAPIAAALIVAGAAALAHLAPMSPLIWLGLAAFVYCYPRGFPRNAIWLAAIFGLIHGCGFAGALNDLDLPKARLLASLLGFNLGVEAGQATIIGGALAVGLAARHLPIARRRDLAQLAGAALFAVGGFWFVGRLLS
jgi:HupE / UreJ protein